MIDIHEIPDGSRLYFAKSARQKRKIETTACEILNKSGYEEMVTPIFSYHQDSGVAKKKLIKYPDKQNSTIYLRADSSIDVIRLITKRVKRVNKHKKWFYIQPIFRYPSTEYNQIGAEKIGDDNLEEMIKTVIKIFDKLNIKPTLQISNINIPNLMLKLNILSHFDFKHGLLDNTLNNKLKWVSKLIQVKNTKDISKDIDVFPLEIKNELINIKTLGEKISYEKTIFYTLYYPKTKYYEGLIFRFIEDNRVVCIGGVYKVDNIECIGFSIYTDCLIAKLS